MKANEVHSFDESFPYAELGMSPACKRCWLVLVGPFDMDVSKYPAGSVMRECISQEEANSLE